MSISIREEAKQIIITGTLKPSKFFVQELFKIDLETLEIYKTEMESFCPADEITEMPHSAELVYNGDIIAILEENLQINSFSADIANVTATIHKGIVPGKIYDNLKKNVATNTLLLWFLYYPIHI